MKHKWLYYYLLCCFVFFCKWEKISSTSMWSWQAPGYSSIHMEAIWPLLRPRQGGWLQLQHPEILGLNTLSEGKEDMLVNFPSMKQNAKITAQRGMINSAHDMTAISPCSLDPVVCGLQWVQAQQECPGIRREMNPNKPSRVWPMTYFLWKFAPLFNSTSRN